MTAVIPLPDICAWLAIMRGIMHSPDRHHCSQEEELVALKKIQ